MSLAELKALGYELKELMGVGFLPFELREVRRASVSLLESAVGRVVACGGDTGRARGGGFSCARRRLLSAERSPPRREIASSPRDRLLAERSPPRRELTRARGLAVVVVVTQVGFTASELKVAGKLTEAALKEAGFTAKELREQGFTVSTHRPAGPPSEPTPPPCLLTWPLNARTGSEGLRFEPRGVDSCSTSSAPR